MNKQPQWLNKTERKTVISQLEKRLSQHGSMSSLLLLATVALKESSLRTMPSCEEGQSEGIVEIWRGSADHAQLRAALCWDFPICKLIHFLVKATLISAFCYLQLRTSWVTDRRAKVGAPIPESKAEGEWIKYTGSIFKQSSSLALFDMYISIDRVGRKPN